MIGPTGAGGSRRSDMARETLRGITHPDRKLGDLDVEELVRTALGELAGLREYLAGKGGCAEAEDLVVNAFLASIGARVAVAEIKLREQGR
jgi:hypothetical protein